MLIPAVPAGSNFTVICYQTSNGWPKAGLKVNITAVMSGCTASQTILVPVQRRPALTLQRALSGIPLCANERSIIITYFADSTVSGGLAHGTLNVITSVPDVTCTYADDRTAGGSVQP